MGLKLAPLMATNRRESRTICSASGMFFDHRSHGWIRIKTDLLREIRIHPSYPWSTALVPQNSAEARPVVRILRFPPQHSFDFFVGDHAVGHGRAGAARRGGTIKVRYLTTQLRRQPADYLCPGRGGIICDVEDSAAHICRRLQA